jgi:hypothetical protein
MAMSKRWYWSTALCSYLSNSRASEIERISSRNPLIVLKGDRADGFGVEGAVIRNGGR